MMSTSGELEPRKEKGGELVPDFMKDYPEDQRGLEAVQQYVKPPFLKVVQPQSDTELRNIFDDGDVITVPARVILAPVVKNENGKSSTESNGAGTPFYFTPIFFYTEYALWNPIALKGKSPAIVERSFDPKSEIAVRACNADKRYQDHPDYPGDSKMQQRYVEHLNFLVCIHDTDFVDRPMVMSFSRGEHTTGQRLCTMLDMRAAPLFGTVFQGSAGYRENDLGKWYGIDPSIPADRDSFVRDEEEFQKFEALHKKFKELHSKKMIETVYSDGETVEEPVTDDGPF